MTNQKKYTTMVLRSTDRDYIREMKYKKRTLAMSDVLRRILEVFRENKLEDQI